MTAPLSTEQLLAEADALALRLAHSSLPLSEASIVMQLRARLAFLASQLTETA